MAILFRKALTMMWRFVKAGEICRHYNFTTVHYTTHAGCCGEVLEDMLLHHPTRDNCYSSITIKAPAKVTKRVLTQITTVSLQ